MAISAVILVLSLYVVNCFTYFRLTNDTVRYFSIMETLNGSWPKELGDTTDFLPYGYVYLLFALAKLHILNSFSVAFVQLCMLCGSVWFVSKIFDKSVPLWLLALFTGLNWLAIKFTITPLSEIQFLFFCSGSVYFFQSFQLKKSYTSLIYLLAFLIGAILTRSAGISLIAAVAYCFFIKHIRVAKLSATRYRIIFIPATIAVVIAIYFIVSRQGFVTYVSDYFGPYLDHPLATIANNLKIHFSSWAELFLNVPLSHTGFLLDRPTGTVLYVLSGVLLFAIFLYQLFRRGNAVPFIVRTYLIFYLILIFNWPAADPRFWVPVLPFVAAVLLVNSRKWKPIVTKIQLIYVAYYMLTGVFVAFYFTKVSLDRSTLIHHHDAGIWRNEYEVHFGISQRSDSVQLNEKAMFILEKYDKQEENQ